MTHFLRHAPVVSRHVLSDEAPILEGGARHRGSDGGPLWRGGGAWDSADSAQSSSRHSYTFPGTKPTSSSDASAHSDGRRIRHIWPSNLNQEGALSSGERVAQCPSSTGKSGPQIALYAPVMAAIHQEPPRVLSFDNHGHSGLVCQPTSRASAGPRARRTKPLGTLGCAQGIGKVFWKAGTGPREDLSNCPITGTNCDASPSKCPVSITDSPGALSPEKKIYVLGSKSL